MKRTLVSIFTAIFLLTQSVAIVAALTLDRIGSTTVTGTISSWSFYGTNPVLSGTTDPSAAVTISLSGLNQSVTADGSGAWSYTPTNLVDPGSYPITINSTGSTISFTLALSTASGSATTNTIFSTSEASATSSSTATGQPTLPSELPQSGTGQETLFLLAGGFGLLSAGVLFYWKVVPKLLFEESVDVRDDSRDTHLS